MNRLSNLTFAVSTYKKNFLIRKKRFSLEKLGILKQRRIDREKRIEEKQKSQKIKNKGGSILKKFDFFDNVKRFLAFTLAGLILSNLDKIIPIFQEIFKKIGEIVTGIKDFVEGTIGSLRSFIQGFNDTKQKFEDLINPILRSDFSNFDPFQNKFGALLNAILGIANTIFGLYETPRAPAAAFLRRPSVPATAFRAKSLTERAAKQAAKKTVARKLVPRATTSLSMMEQSLAAISGQSIKEVEEFSKKKVVKKLTTTTARESAEALVGAAAKGQPTGSPTPPVPPPRGISPLFLADKNPNATSVGSRISELARRQLNQFDLQELQELREYAKKKGFTESVSRIDDLTKPVKRLKVKRFTMPDSSGTSKPQLKPGIKGENLLKRMSGYFKPSTFAQIRNMAATFGIGVAFEFAAFWALDRVSEAVGLDFNSQVRARVDRFIKMDDAARKDYIKLLNNELEKELEYQKSFLGVTDKVIALGGDTVSDRKAKLIAGVLTAIASTGLSPVYGDLLSSVDIPDYLRGDVPTEFNPSTPPSVVPQQFKKGGTYFLLPKLVSQSKLPSLPPTGTGSPALAAAQQYGAKRPGGRLHAGQDFDPADDKNSKFYSRIGGEVIYAQNAGGGYGNVVDIYNKDLGYTERIAEGDRIHVREGQFVKQGDLVQSGSTFTGVFHYEIRKGKATHSGSFAGTVDPLKFLEQLKNNSQLQSSIKPPSSQLISSASGLNQPTTYSQSGMMTNNQVINYVLPIKVPVPV